MFYRAKRLSAHADGLSPLKQVYFTMDTGIQVANVLSYGADDELLLTYSFAGGIPGIDASKPKPSSQELSRTIGGAVQGSIDVIRKGAVEGKW